MHSLSLDTCRAVVIVEEAGEILEANLIAVLSQHLQHLIMIGDHKQLRPQVENYYLVKKFKVYWLFAQLADMMLVRHLAL